VIREQQDHVVIQDHKDLLDLLALRVLVDLKVTREIQEHKVFQ
jgi:hypothetical protein